MDITLTDSETGPGAVSCLRLGRSERSKEAAFWRLARSMVCNWYDYDEAQGPSPLHFNRSALLHRYKR